MTHFGSGINFLRHEHVEPDLFHAPTLTLKQSFYIFYR